MKRKRETVVESRWTNDDQIGRLANLCAGAADLPLAVSHSCYRPPVLNHSRTGGGQVPNHHHHRHVWWRQRRKRAAEQEGISGNLNRSTTGNSNQKKKEMSKAEEEQKLGNSMAADDVIAAVDQSRKQRRSMANWRQIGTSGADNNNNNDNNNDNDNDSLVNNQLKATTWTRMLLELILMTFVASQSCQASTLTDFDGATFYKAPVGSRVRIACNGSHWNDESVSLVLWFKGTIERHSVPIYTVDARQKPLNSGARHFISDAYKGRAKFVTKATPPYLDLAPLEEEDQSEYRCRIDYRSKPRENFLIILFVLVPPKSVQIMDSNGRSLEQIYGPLSEGSDLTLLCLSKGGRPAPSVRWKRRTKVIDDSYLTLNDFLALKQSGQLLASGGVVVESLSSSPSPQKVEAEKFSSQPSKSNSSRIRSQAATTTNGGSDNNQHHWRQQRKHNQQQQPNSINADPSFGLLEALWQEWRSWPEYDYYTQQMARLSAELANSSAISQAQEESLYVRLSSSSSSLNNHQQQKQTAAHTTLSNNETNEQRKQVGGGEQPTGSAAGQQSQQQQLLTLNVHESITTAINVLKLTNLSPANLEVDQARGASTVLLSDMSTFALNTNEQQPQQHNNEGQPAIECEASNLHYDLRTLIKMFAPPSLSAASTVHSSGQGSGLNTATTAAAAQQTLPTSSSRQQLTGELIMQSPVLSAQAHLQLSRQLAEAIDRALESTLRNSADLASATTTTSISGSAPGTNANEPDNSATAALKQIKMEQQQQTNGGSGNNNTNLLQAELFMTHHQQQLQQHSLHQLSEDKQGIVGSAQATNSAANVIYQQLSRPHQLSSLTTSSSAGSTAPGESHQPTTTSTVTTTLASGSPLVRSKLIALDVYLRPLDVKITTPQRHLSAGQLAEFSCTSSGAQPAAKLSWLKNGQLLELKLSRQINEPKGNLSHSKLTIHLEQQDNGAQLTCRAENEQLTRLIASQQQQPLYDGAGDSPTGVGQSTALSSVLEDSRTLTVHYPPKVRLELGNKILSNAIREGTDIYFVCHVEAMPPIKEITWLHNERPVNESSTQTATTEQEGLIISNNSLVLQRVKVQQRGHYACMASNSEGLSESNRIELRVLRAPICALPSIESGSGDQWQPVFAGSGSGHSPLRSMETNAAHAAINSNLPVLVANKIMPLRAHARFLCQMEADPPELEVTWYLNNSHNERRVLFTGRTGALGVGAPGEELRTQEQELLSADQDNNNRKQYQDESTDQSSEQERNRTITANRLMLHKTTTTTGSTFATTSQLNYLVDTNLDYGRLYCVARNSIGEQKRACVYDLHRPDPRDAPPLSCLAVNITISSVWIGCDLVPQQDNNNNRHQRTRFAIEVYKSASRLKSDQLSPSDELPNQFVSSSDENDDDNNNNNNNTDTELTTANGAAAGNEWQRNNNNYQTTVISGKLEANFSSLELDEPLFTVNNLRPETGYTLRVYAFDLFNAKLSQPSVVRFSTSRELTNSRQQQQQQAEKLTVEPLSIGQHQSSSLLSALISTRSTNGHLAPTSGANNGESLFASPHSAQHNNSSSTRWLYQYHHNHHHHQQQQQRLQSQEASGLLGGLSAALSSVFGSSLFQVFRRPDSHSSSGPTAATQQQQQQPPIPGAAKQLNGHYKGSQQQQPNSRGNNQLMEISDAFLITSVCLALLVSITIMLFLRSRYSSSRACLLTTKQLQAPPPTTATTPTLTDESRGSSSKTEEEEEEEEREQDETSEFESATISRLPCRRSSIDLIHAVGANPSSANVQQQQSTVRCTRARRRHLNGEPMPNDELLDNDYNNDQEADPGASTNQSTIGGGNTSTTIDYYETSGGSSLFANATNSATLPHPRGHHPSSGSSSSGQYSKLISSEANSMRRPARGSLSLLTSTNNNSGGIRGTMQHYSNGGPGAGGVATLTLDAVAAACFKSNSISQTPNHHHHASGQPLNTFLLHNSNGGAAQHHTADTSTSPPSAIATAAATCRSTIWNGGATPIRVTKSRSSSVCFESMLMAAEQQQQQRLIQFTDGRRLISDANLSCLFSNEPSIRKSGTYDERDGHTNANYRQSMAPAGAAAAAALAAPHEPHEPMSSQMDQWPSYLHLCSVANGGGYGTVGSGVATSAAATILDGGQSRVPHQSVCRAVDEFHDLALMSHHNLDITRNGHQLQQLSGTSNHQPTTLLYGDSATAATTTRNCQDYETSMSGAALIESSEPLNSIHNSSQLATLSSVNDHDNHAATITELLQIQHQQQQESYCPPSSKDQCPSRQSLASVQTADNPTSPSNQLFSIVVAPNSDYSDRCQTNKRQTNQNSLSRILRRHRPNSSNQGCADQHQRGFFANRQSSSLVSDESSGSNAYCTWTLQNGEHLEPDQTMHFIELLPSSADCMDMSLMVNNVLSSACTTNHQVIQENNNNNCFDGQTNDQTKLSSRPCTSLTSSSIGSSSVKDQAVSSPLSLTNNTLSNTESLLNNNGASVRQESPAYDSTMKRKDHLYSSNSPPNAPLTSILKNSSAKYQHSPRYSDQQPENVCQCNGKDTEERL